MPIPQSRVSPILRFPGSEVVEIPTQFGLEQNYPNPFNPTTAIEFDIPSNGNATVEVYNSLRQEVATLVNDNLATERYRVNWNAACVASGVYFYRLSAQTGDGKSFTQVRKLMMLK